MFWAGLILTLLGTAVQNREQKKANERKRGELQAGREKEKGVEAKQRGDVLTEAEKYDPALRQEKLDTEASKTEQQILDVLSDNEALTTGDTGVVSEALGTQRAQSTRDRANTASIMAALQSKVRAPRDVGAQDELDMLDLTSRSQGRSSELGRIGRTTNTLADLEGMVDPGKMALGGLASGFGMSAASSSIMSKLQPPGGAVPYPNMTPNPGYQQVDWNTLADNWQQ